MIWRGLLKNIGTADAKKPPAGQDDGTAAQQALLDLRYRFIFEDEQDFQKVEREEIVGLDYVFEELDPAIQMLSDVESFLGADDLGEFDTGALLAGSSGVGKTFCALHAATKANARFIKVSEFPKSTQKGFTADDIWWLFALSRQYVKEVRRGLILFWEEIDAYVSGESDERRAAVAMLKEELSGTNGKPVGVFLIATSRNYSSIPSDLLRDGRIGINIFVDYPTRTAKNALLRHEVARVRHGEIDFDSLAHLLQSSMTPVTIKKVVRRAWQLSRIRSVKDQCDPLLTQDDLMTVLLRRLRGAPGGIVLSDEKLLHHARNVAGRALVARALDLPVQLVTLSRRGYSGPYVISEVDDDEGIREYSVEWRRIATELATLAVDELCGHATSSLTSHARQTATTLALSLIEEHGFGKTSAQKHPEKRKKGSRRLVSLTAIANWRTTQNLPSMLGVNDYHVEDYDAVKSLLEERLEAATEILARYGKEGIDEVAQKLIGDEGIQYLTQRDLDACLKSDA